MVSNKELGFPRAVSHIQVSLGDWSTLSAQIEDKDLEGLFSERKTWIYLEKNIQ